METTRYREREITFRVQTRPLRLASLVRDIADLTNTVGLYTHVWGGGANRIFPVPADKDAEQEQVVFQLLESFDPDYIFAPREINPRSWHKGEPPEDAPAYLHQLRAKYLSRLQHMVNADGVRAFGALKGWIGCGIAARGGGRTGYLLPNSFVLSDRYSLGLKRDDSRLLLPPQDSGYDFYFKMKMGAPCPEFAEHLRDALGASTLRSPTCYPDMLVAQLVCCERATPVTTTTEHIKSTLTNFSNSDEAIFFDDDVLGLFLCRSTDDLHTACCFWNARGPSRAESLILPRCEVEAHLEETVKILCEAFPALRGVYVVTPGNAEVLTHWHSIVKAAFTARGLDIPVRAIASDRRFPGSAPSLKWGNPITLSRSVRSDNSVIFSPPVPPAHDRRDGGHAFACDVEVTMEGGRKLNLPHTPDSAILLSRSLDFAEYMERDLGRGNDFLLTCASVRPHWNGLTLIATAGEEATFFLPTDETVITRHLSSFGCKVRANRQTRYARGIVNVLGGFVEATRFFRNNGLDVLQALCDKKAHQCGFEMGHIEAGIHKNRNRLQDGKQDKTSERKSGPDQRAQIQSQLKPLLDAGLVRRGFALTCPHCDLKEWHSVESMRQIVECPGCAQTFSLPFENPKYYYKANELAVRCLAESGGIAVLKAASWLRSVEDSGCVQFGAEFSRDGAPDIEVDLIWSLSDFLLLAECKSLHYLEEQQVKDITDSLDRTLEAATLLEAQAVLLAVYTPAEGIAPLCQILEARLEDAKARGVALHLLLNDKIYLQQDFKEGRDRVFLEELLPSGAQNSLEDNLLDVGEWPESRRLSQSVGINQDLIKGWLNRVIETTDVQS